MFELAPQYPLSEIGRVAGMAIVVGLIAMYGIVSIASSYFNRKPARIRTADPVRNRSTNRLQD